MLTIPVALTCGFIRIGNFINQEIVGTPTSLPWGVVFGHPVDGSGSIPRHPVQLYEALGYFVLFYFLLRVWQTKKESIKTGLLSGLFFTILFTFRFFIEFFKESQGQLIENSSLQTGQLLSIPCIIIGITLLFYSRNK